MTFCGSNPKAIRVCVLPGLLLCIACAGIAWQPVELRPERFRVGKTPRLARIILENGDTLLAYNPVLTGDSVVWIGPTHDSAADASVRPDAVRVHAIPTRQIAAVETAQDPGASTKIGVAFVLWSIALSAMWVWVIGDAGVP